MALILSISVGQKLHFYYIFIIKIKKNKSWSKDQTNEFNLHSDSFLYLSQEYLENFSCVFHLICLVLPSFSQQYQMRKNYAK
ncbi:hypothetical protein BpHYR1_049707 [Brachionus plicatilis]|uniref:Uncharacterized protein n=1 Tax=Brachionus plicatilis TaxID=10195 RepID=A0A3M7QK60_BRAPC|nr:hypothetical protein BpHYR1_049707 [Brachionus plicatilis]